MDNIFCAWWNLENLFDEENAKDRSDKLSKVLGNELKGWSKEVLDKKIAKLSFIINKMNEGKGPDIIGVAEVENRKVLLQLKNSLSRKTYSIIHINSKDERGIDVGFIFDNTVFKRGKVFSHFIMKRTATRDIVQVNMKFKKNNKDIVFIGNHWPSRSAGGYESEPYRIIAGETLAYFHERIYEELGSNVPVIAMGDFNDNPYNRSILDYALATNSGIKIKSAKTIKYFYNLMWKHLAEGTGSYYFDGFDVLDQFLVSGNIYLNKCFVSIDEAGSTINNFPEMSKNGKPIRFGRPREKKSYNPDGYSDHFPISLRLNIK